MEESLFRKWSCDARNCNARSCDARNCNKRRNCDAWSWNARNCYARWRDEGAGARSSSWAKEAQVRRRTVAMAGELYKTCKLMIEKHKTHSNVSRNNVNRGISRSISGELIY